MSNAGAHERRRERKRIRIPVDVAVTVHVIKPRKADHKKADHKFKRRQRKRMKTFRRRQRERMGKFRRRQRGRGKDVENRVFALEAQMNKLLQEFKKAPPSRETTSLAAQIIMITRQIDEINAKIEQAKKEGKELDPELLAALEELSKKIHTIRGHLGGKEGEKPVSAPSAETIAHLDKLKTALIAYLHSEEKLLRDYDTYRESIYEPSHEEALPPAAVNQLSQSWDEYKEAVKVLNGVLAEIGMGDKEVPVNQEYELFVNAALAHRKHT